jgi:hypothetical protein
MAVTETFSVVQREGSREHFVVSVAQAMDI